MLLNIYIIIGVIITIAIYKGTHNDKFIEQMKEEDEKKSTRYSEVYLCIRDEFDKHTIMSFIIWTTLWPIKLLSRY